MFGEIYIVTPPLLLQNKTVEVVSIDPLMKTFSIVVVVKAAPLQIYTPQIQALIAKKVAFAVKELVSEGFIPDPKANNWTVTITGIAEP